MQILENMMANEFLFTPKFVQGLGVTLLSPQCLLGSGYYFKHSLDISWDDSFQKEGLSKNTLDWDTCNIVWNIPTHFIIKWTITTATWVFLKLDLISKEQSYI